MSKTSIHFKLTCAAARVPERASEGDVGHDLRAVEHAVIQPGKRHVIGTGVQVAIQSGSGVFGAICSRSGLAAKHGIAVLNSPGIIDRSYRGELKVILVNHGDDPFEVLVGDRIAQFVLLNESSETADWIALAEGEEFDTTTRGEGGLGSTGVST